MLVRIFISLLVFQSSWAFAQSIQLHYDFTKYWSNGNWTGELHKVPGEIAIPVVVAKILLPFATGLGSIQPLPQFAPPQTFKTHFHRVPHAIPLCSVPGFVPQKCRLKDWNTVKYPVGDPIIQEKYGYRVVLVPIYPVQYDANNQVAASLQNISLDVELVPQPTSPNYRGLLYDLLDIRTIVDNPEMADTYPASPIEPNNVKQYLVIAPKSWIPQFQPLLNEKNLRGINTSTDAVEDISVKYPGKDLQEKIRNAIIQHYRTEGTEYVLLVGDGYTVLPTRKFRVVASQTADLASRGFGAPPNLPPTHFEPFSRSWIYDA